MHTTRRTFLHLSGGAAAAAWAASRAATAPGAGVEVLASAVGTPKKAVLVSMLPKELSISIASRSRRDIGFEGTEVHTTTDKAEADAMKCRLGRDGLKIHSVMNEAHWEFPLSSADPGGRAEERVGEWRRRSGTPRCSGPAPSCSCRPSWMPRRSYDRRVDAFAAGHSRAPSAVGDGAKSDRRSRRSGTNSS